MHTFGMPGAVDVVFLGHGWQVLAFRGCLPPARWLPAPRATQAALLLAAGRCTLTGLEPGMTLYQDAAARLTLPFATTLLRRNVDAAKSEP